MEVLENSAPLLHAIDKRRLRHAFTPFTYDRREAIDVLEIFEHVRDIRDPEHPHSLEALGVVKKDQIQVDDSNSTVFLLFTPTIPKCSMATLIGLSIKVKLIRSLPRRFKIHVEVTPGSHDTEVDINKQLADKERVAAAMENPALARMVNECLAQAS